MKWKMYQTCLNRGFARFEYLELEKHALSKLDQKHHKVFQDCDLSQFKFPDFNSLANFDKYFESLKLTYFPEESQVCSSGNIQMHNRVKNCDITALMTKNDEYACGDVDDIDWLKFCTSAFKKVAGQINRRNNGDHRATIDEEWNTIIARLGPNLNFMKKMAKHWPAVVRLDAIERGILEDEIFSGRDGFTEINVQ